MVNLMEYLVDDCQQFKDECIKNEQRATLTYFGLDLIIEKTGKIFGIEINGQYSGSKGIELAYGKDFVRENLLEKLASYGLPVTIYVNSKAEAETEIWAEGKQGIVVKDFGKLELQLSKDVLGTSDCSDQEYYHQLALLRKQELLDFVQRYKLLLDEKMGLIKTGQKPTAQFTKISQAEGIIFNNTHRRYKFDEGRFIVINPFHMEFIIGNKMLTSFMAPGFTDNYTLDNFSSSSFEKKQGIIKRKLKKYLRHNVDKIVFKPVGGSGGFGVCVFPIKQILGNNSRLKNSFFEMIESPKGFIDNPDLVQDINYLKSVKETVLLQPFIESKPFKSSLTGQPHYACIRYSVLVESQQSKIQLYHLGGYARLAKGPIGESNDKVANLAKGATAEPLAARDLNRIRTWANRIIPVFYRRLLRLGQKGFIAHPMNYVLMEKDFKKIYQQPWRWA
ncbi:MAG TPA: hypothetical protein VJH68_05310 [Candidatus Nanoarchaeia archaeon]|nr:hypothetical protein [Candidatus Nanoarchaeia archaeon]